MQARVEKEILVTKRHFVTRIKNVYNYVLLIRHNNSF